METPAAAWLIPAIDFYNSPLCVGLKQQQLVQGQTVIRCAVAAWVSTVLFLIPAFEHAVGQVSGTWLLPSDFLTLN